MGSGLAFALTQTQDLTPPRIDAVPGVVVSTVVGTITIMCMAGPAVFLLCNNSLEAIPVDVAFSQQAERRHVELLNDTRCSVWGQVLRLRLRKRKT